MATQNFIHYKVGPLVRRIERRMLKVEREFDATRKDLSATIRELKVSKEDLPAVNIDAFPIGEVFQSANDELPPTSKEKLQAFNEELIAVNSQLQETSERQRTATADVQNPWNSADVATILLDTTLNIRFFTSAAKLLFGGSGLDIERSLAELARRFRDDALLPDVHAVLSDLTSIQREIQSEDGNWYIRSVAPYRNDAGAVAGVVLVFARISGLKAVERKVEVTKAYAERVIKTVKQPLVVLDENLQILLANESFLKVFDLKREEVIGKPFEILNRFQTQDELLDCVKRSLNYSDEHPVHAADSQAQNIESLTTRQRQILDLVLAGIPSKNIAADLGISQRTVDSHRAAIMRKAGAKSLSVLIRLALTGRLK